MPLPRQPSARHLRFPPSGGEQNEGDVTSSGALDSDEKAIAAQYYEMGGGYGRRKMVREKQMWKV